MRTRTDAEASQLRVAGLTSYSSVDWPGKLTATVFMQGCPWDCFFCHNPALIDPRAPGAIDWSEVVTLLEQRMGLLDGVVFSGGEPTMQRALPAAMEQVRSMGFRVGLHTGGAYPELLERSLPLADWVGLDVKAMPARYEEVTRRGPSAARAWQSLSIVLATRAARAGSEHPLDVEVRTTVHPRSFDPEALRELGHALATVGVPVWAVQRFRSAGARADAVASAARPGHDPIAGIEELAHRFEQLIVR